MSVGLECEKARGEIRRIDAALREYRCQREGLDTMIFELERKLRTAHENKRKADEDFNKEYSNELG
jgi:hypothetical protein